MSNNNTNNSIKSFKMYRVQVGTSFNMIGDTRFLISHDCTHLKGKVWCLFEDVMITNAIKTEYNITNTTYVNECYLLHSPLKLNFDEINNIHKQVLKGPRTYAVTGTNAHIFTLNLLELLMINWLEWN